MPLKPSPILPENLKLLKDFIYRESGIVVDDDKHYLLEARLLPVAERHRFRSVNDLCNLIRGTGYVPGVRREIIEAMTTHETLFFREQVQYDALRTTVLPELLEGRKHAKMLNFWSAAASSGQEAYSLAMLLREMNLEDWKCSILATDLSEKILSRAREGKYMAIEVDRGLPKSYLSKYFEASGADWQISADIRKMVTFQAQDLRGSTRHLGPFDVVFCRNVLIYFDQETCRRILASIRSTMRQGGYLLLSAAENPAGLTSEFERIAHGKAVFYRLR